MVARTENTYTGALRQVALPTDEAAIADQVVKLAGDARIVMLGEASHGTSEFYEWRRIISETLIRDHGFRFIAVEGDWPDCQRVHRHITETQAAGNRQQAVGGDEPPTASPREALAGYRRFPTWMWGNEEVLELVEWLRGYNDAQGHGRTSHFHRRPIGFHGLDVYSLHDSMKLVVDYLRRVDPAAAEGARRAYACFDPYADPVAYARATRFVPENCEAQVRAALTHMQRLENLYSRVNPDHTDPQEAYFDATMNARVTQNAERYYRTMLRGEAASWNVRDRHMMETLDLLLEHYGAKARALVWAHNTHIGDYHATDMLRAGYVNIGGLAREQYGADAVRLIGFGTHRGTVIAANEWGDEPETMTVPEAMEGSLEDHLHRLVMPAAWLPLREVDDAVGQALNQTIGHRAIGVVYHPEYERPGQYVPTRLADRYDGFIFIDETEAVHPLGIAADLAEEPEAWPSGL